MNDLAVMLAAVRADPCDPVARLLLADALEDAGRDGRLQRAVAAGLAPGALGLPMLKDGLCRALGEALSAAFGLPAEPDATYWPNLELRLATAAPLVGVTQDWREAVGRLVSMTVPGAGGRYYRLVLNPWDTGSMIRRRRDGWLIESTQAALLQIVDQGTPRVTVHPDAYPRWFAF